MRNLFSSLLPLVCCNWGKILLTLVVIAGGVTYATIPLVREKADAAWHSALAWAGITESSVDTSKVFWCPMHPQIKSKRENAVCPICNMALVELEGGIVAARQYLTLTAQQIQQAGVVTEPVIRRKLYREIDTTGRIDYDERRYAGISSWISGKSRIDKLHVSFTGEFVQQGTPMVELYSASLISAQEEYLIARQALARRKSNGSGNSGRYGFSPDSLVRSSRQKLQYQGLTPAQIEQLDQTDKMLDRFPILAPISGTVIERHVQEGQYVDEGDWLFHLADLTHLWLFVDIFEDDLSLVQIGDLVQMSVQAFPDEAFTGSIAFVEPKVAPETRTIRVRIDIGNPDNKLIPGMYARAVVRRELSLALAVPENAVLHSGQRAIVVVKNGEGTYQPREVQLGRKWLFAVENGNTTSPTLGFGNDRVRFHEVRAGLTPGDEVVTAGAFLLNAESQFQNVLAKMLPPASQRATLEQVVGQRIAERMRGILDAYFKLSQSLADDKLDEVPARLSALSEASNALVHTASEADSGQLTTDAKQFHKLIVDLSSQPPKDAHDARIRFARISRELTTLLARHGGKTLFGKDLYQFECGMAKVGYERWLWWSPEIHNPYMGQRMLKCGKKLDVLEP